MDVVKAAKQLLINYPGEAEYNDKGMGVDHSRWMLRGIALGYVQYDKAHRWLGYAQGVLVQTGNATLEDMKENNR